LTVTLPVSSIFWYDPLLHSGVKLAVYGIVVKPGPLEPAPPITVAIPILAFVVPELRLLPLTSKYLDDRAVSEGIATRHIYRYGIRTGVNFD
jgi:hypothetical protein